MTPPLQYIVEPERLLLTWQPSDENAQSRTRRVVGEVSPLPEGGWGFRYLTDHPDYQRARELGFEMYPAFGRGSELHKSGVLDTFMRRLPPRKREDFADFLALHRLPSPFPFSEVALLGYTGARLPSDGFALVPIFPADVAPLDCLLEIAGFRHAPEADRALALLQVGDAVSLRADPDNPVDDDAIAIFHGDARIGYVNRALRQTVGRWLANRTVMATIERINGKPARPLIYIRLSIR